MKIKSNITLLKATMKKLFLFIPFFLLLSCANTVMGVNVSARNLPAEQAFPIPPASMVSWGSNQFVSWNCYQQDHNVNLVQLNCEFHNLTSSLQSQCIYLSIYNSSIPIKEMMVYSHVLLPNERNDELAFIMLPERKKMAEQCNEDGSRCFLMSRECNDKELHKDY